MITLLKKLVNVLSDQSDYQSAVSLIDEALISGKLSPTDKRQRAMELVEPKGWRSRTDGLDWVELELYAKENKMPFKSVTDLLSVLKSLADKR